MTSHEDARNISMEELNLTWEELKSVLSPYGFEMHPLKVGWYNEQVGGSFRLPYHHDTLAFVIISCPSMFEKAFIPYVAAVDCHRSSNDPLDQCMVDHFAAIKKKFPDVNVEIIHDFEVTPARRPKVLVQTAGHVSGAVRYYQRKDLTSDPWEANKKIFGVCLHPRYGGWFALRGVAIFAGLRCADLPRCKPRDILGSEGEVVELLARYNDRWQDWTFRDVIPVEERYSQQQREYFTTRPGDRASLLTKYRQAPLTNA